MRWTCILILMLQASIVFANDASHPETASLRDTEDFIKAEEQRIKAIKLLSLDLEKLNLELKQKEIQAKMTQLDKTGPMDMPVATPSTEGQPPAAKRLIGLTVAANLKEAVVEVNGIKSIVHEADTVAGGKVHITDNEVTLVYPSGKQEKLRFN